MEEVRQRLPVYLIEFLEDERGVTQTVEQALLIAATIAAFFVLVVNPVAGVVDLVWNLPELTDKKFLDFVTELRDRLGGIFHWGEAQANVTANSTVP